MTDEQQQEALRAVVDWITESLGSGAATDWLWACTPFPCGPPTPQMLEEGLAVAVGEMTLDALMGKVEAEMDRQMATLNESVAEEK